MLGATMLASCSTASRVASTDGLGSPAETARRICAVDEKSRVKGVDGRVWMKARSKEASGQFPANVQARADSGLKLEVTHLMGARAALIEIRGEDFKVETPDQGSVAKKARSWGGIPLEWAGALFMNRVPCPELSAPGLSWSLGPEGVLEGRSQDGAEIWSYRIAARAGFSFIEKVSLRRRGQAPFEMKREDPDPVDGWARRWEIKSGVGEVKVRWRDRKTL
jgi:hypothetical protein